MKEGRGVAMVSEDVSFLPSPNVAALPASVMQSGGGAFGRSSGHEGGAPGMGLAPFVPDPEDSRPFHPVRAQQEGSPRRLEEGSPWTPTPRAPTTAETRGGLCVLVPSPAPLPTHGGHLVGMLGSWGRGGAGNRRASWGSGLSAKQALWPL